MFEVPIILIKANFARLIFVQKASFIPAIDSHALHFLTSAASHPTLCCSWYTFLLPTLLDISMSSFFHMQFVVFYRQHKSIGAGNIVVVTYLKFEYIQITSRRFIGINE